MSNSREQTRDRLNLSYVQRWIVAPTYRTQSVADHTFRVMVIARQLMNEKLGGRLLSPERVLIAAMDHDQDEAHSGDIPGTYKDSHGKEWPHPVTLDLASIVVKVADSMETYTWWMAWGHKGWTSPNCPGIGDHCRDIRKILWYTQDWPELLEAVRMVMIGSMGWDPIIVRSLFGGE